MSDATFVVVTFIFLAIAIGFVVFFFLQLGNLPPNPQPPPNPDNVACSPDQILQAWIRNLPNRQACPAFTNNYIIATDELKMFEKDFEVDSQTGCCWFSNQSNQRKYFPNPWICISQSSGDPFTLQELNQKPYSFNDGTTTFIIPPCENDEKNCIGLVRFDTSSTTMGEGTGTVVNGLYKIFLFDGSMTNFSANNPETGNIQTAPFEDVVFTIGQDCIGLKNVTISGMVVVQEQNGKPEFVVSKDQLPSFVVKITQLFRDGRFYPIPGADPVLTENAKMG